MIELPQGLQSQLDRPLLGSTVQQWSIAALIVVVSWTVAWTMRRGLGQVRRRWAKPGTFTELGLSLAHGPVYWIIFFSGLFFAVDVLTVPPWVHKLRDSTSTVVIVLMVTMFVSRFVDHAFKAWFSGHEKDGQTTAADTLVPILRKASKLFVWAMGSLVVVRGLGYDVLSIITSLGILGLAVAMAAKDTLSNMFGSLAIFLDQPFQVGDTIVMGGFTGTVEEIGLRSTRLRTAEDTLVSIPNSEVANGKIENLSARGGKRETVILRLPLHLSGDDCERACEVTRKAALSPEVRDVSCRLTSFAPTHLELELIFWALQPGQAAVVRHQVLLQVKRHLEAAGFRQDLIGERRLSA